MVVDAGAQVEVVAEQCYGVIPGLVEGRLRLWRRGHVRVSVRSDDGRKYWQIGIRVLYCRKTF